MASLGVADFEVIRLLLQVVIGLRGKRGTTTGTPVAAVSERRR
jgi:hypothetical protein